MRIMFVCHGNICRSPMAEFIFKRILEEQGIEDVFVSSAATSTEEIYNGIGNFVYPPAKAKLAEHGISCEGKRAVQLKKADYHQYDYILAMDTGNVNSILKIFGGDPEYKVHKLLEYTGCDDDVADPWFTRDFETTYQDVYAGCVAFFKEIKDLLA